MKIVVEHFCRVGYHFIHITSRRGADMTTRILPPSAILAGLFFLPGCADPFPSEPPAPADIPKVVANSPLPVAPAPRAKSDGLPPPVAVFPSTPGAGKPWAELIVGKWLQVHHTGWVGYKIREYTKDGKVIERYIYPEAPNRPKGMEVGTWEYRVEGNTLGPPKEATDDGTTVMYLVNVIESVTDGELVVLTTRRSYWSLNRAREEAARRKIPLAAVLEEVREKQARTYYIRLKDY